jgi:hypothetical protein
MRNIMDNKHERNYIFGYLCGHTIVDTYEDINTIKTKTYKLVIDLLYSETPIDQQGI